jgi:phospholipase C
MRVSHLRRMSRAVATVTAAACLLNLSPVVAGADEDDGYRRPETPIKHVVVIFQENVSFDHYFATYPHAANLPGESVFTADHQGPRVNNLFNARLLAPHNQNSVQPFRLSRAQNDTCDQDHGYTDEQAAMNEGEMDRFVETVGVGGPGCADYGLGRGLVMGYYDGSTVTALWNYALHFAMSDNFFNTTFGPSSPGALNLISGQTGGAIPADLSTPLGVDTIAGAVISDPQPFFDDCTTRDNVRMTGRNVGDLLNARNVTWGFFQGGFTPSTPATFAADGSVVTKAKCVTSHIGSDGKPKGDYIPHHQPFQYYASTSNPHHLPPSSVAAIGHTDQANHQYDLSDFWDAVAAGNLPAVSYLKAAGHQDGHAAYSSPLAEQTFIVETLNRLQARPEWRDMAVFITYDDSDGWYDHVVPPITNHSATAQDAAICTGGSPSLGAQQGRCGYGPRLPLLVISPFARKNHVDHGVSDQSSILRFIEDNWHLGRLGGGSFDAIAGSLLPMFDFDERRDDRLILDPSSGEIVTSGDRD